MAKKENNILLKSIASRRSEIKYNSELCTRERFCLQLMISYITDLRIFVTESSHYRFFTFAYTSCFPIFLYINKTTIVFRLNYRIMRFVFIKMTSHSSDERIKKKLLFNQRLMTHRYVHLVESKYVSNQTTNKK